MILVASSVFLLFVPACHAPAVRAETVIVAVEDEPIRSALHGPLFLGDAPPELRTLAAIWIPYAGLAGVPATVERDLEDALEIASDIVRRLREGEEWHQLAAEHSASRNRSSDSVLGSVPRGILQADFDSFLFSSAVGEFSEPVSNERGVFVLRRMETNAACRVIAVSGTGEDARKEAQELARRAREGEDFAELARQHSSHAGSAERGGAWSVFERGPTDSSIKLETFRAAIGEVVGPLQVLDSMFVVKRVPVEEFDAALAENNWIRVRALSLAHDSARPGLRPQPRTALEAMALAIDLRKRIVEGESMAELVRMHDDDPTGAARGGDLGWIHRRLPGLPQPIRGMFLAEVGEVSEPVALEIGVVFMKRDA